MGKPFKLPPHSKDALEDETGRLRLEEINAGRDIIKKELQKQLDKAYEIRGSSLEVKTEEYLEEIRNKSRQ